MIAGERWDPQMRAAQEAASLAAAAYPPIRLEMPFQPQRDTNDAFALLTARGGPDMAQTSDRWAFARGRRVLCRVHKPVTVDNLAILVYFHGGGWVWSSIDTRDRLAREYAAGAGIAVVSVDYALSPEAVFPQALDECAGVVEWLAKYGTDWGLDCSRMVVGGDSAGGNLAFATALKLRDTGGPALRGILALYPVCDSDVTTPSYREFGSGHVLTDEKMRFYWSAYAPHAMTDPLAAPLRAELAGLPPVLVQLAELDVLRSEGESMAARLEAAGVPTALEIFPGVIHGFMRATETVATARNAVARAAEWLKSRLE
jgi:acetyl esterase